jgi:D-glycero-D-manno-heptose 1,7-bisphosphate phosphatase
MLLSAAGELRINLMASYMVGDRWRDIEAGRLAGCTTVLIDSGFREDKFVAPDNTTASLLDAANWILSRRPTS